MLNINKYLISASIDFLLGVYYEKINIQRVFDTNTMPSCSCFYIYIWCSWQISHNFHIHYCGERPVNLVMLVKSIEGYFLTHGYNTTTCSRILTYSLLCRITPHGFQCKDHMMMEAIYSFDYKIFVSVSGTWCPILYSSLK